jgi:hypothetical protein
MLQKNTSDDRSFVFDDFEFTGFAGHRSISAGASACMSAIAYHASHPATDLLRSILALHLSDEAANSDQD